MKRLLAAGAPSMVRIGPVFRAEESGRLHNPEFTMIEWYRLGFDLAQLMQEVAELVDLVLGKERCRSGDVSPPSSRRGGRGCVREQRCGSDRCR